MTDKQKITSPIDPIDPFLKDMEVLFDGRLIAYADIGANIGTTFAAVKRSGLRVNRALLAEPNPKCFAKLQQTVASFGDQPNVVCTETAISDEVGTRVLHDLNDMSMIDAVQTPSDHQFEVKTKRLDDLLDLFPDRHISLLKIDVEGHELEVLRGAETALKAADIDVIYVELAVGADRKGSTNLRLVEDFLAGYGYQIFKFYEQTHDWVGDRPVMTRCNVAFLSDDMVNRHPLTLLNNQKKMRDELAAAQHLLHTKEQEHASALAAVQELLEAKEQKHLAALAEVQESLDAKEQKNAAALAEVQELLEAKEQKHAAALADAEARYDARECEYSRELDRRFAEIAALTDMLAKHRREGNQGARPAAASPAPAAMRSAPVYRPPYRTKIGPYSFRPRQIYGMLITVAWFLGIAALYFYLEAR